jgi:hypothetical protein
VCVSHVVITCDIRVSHFVFKIERNEIVELQCDQSVEQLEQKFVRTGKQLLSFCDEFQSSFEQRNHNYCFFMLIVFLLFKSLLCV